MFDCPQCGTEVTEEEIQANEGYCEGCCEQNQIELDSHNAQIDYWNSLEENEKIRMILVEN